MKQLSILLLFAALLGCSRYERQVPPFKLPDAYANAQEVSGAKVAAYSYRSSEEAQQAFGFDVWDAGLLPVQVVFDNQSDRTFEVNPSQTFLIDSENNVWPILEEKLAYERISGKTEMGNIAASTVKPGVLGSAAGAIIGAAVGIVSGDNVLETAGKGAAVGAAAGMTLGAGSGLATQSAEQQISQDLRNRKLQNKKIAPKEISYGFLFFPAEAGTPRELRLQLKDMASGDTQLLIFDLQQG